MRHLDKLVKCDSAINLRVFYADFPTKTISNENIYVRNNIAHVQCLLSTFQGHKKYWLCTNLRKNDGKITQMNPKILCGMLILCPGACQEKQCCAKKIFIYLFIFLRPIAYGRLVWRVRRSEQKEKEEREKFTCRKKGKTVKSEKKGRR